MIINELDSKFYSLVRQDYELLDKIKLRSNGSYWEVLKPQTMEGHAREGHCAFRRQDTLVRTLDKKTKDILNIEELEGDVELKRKKIKKRNSHLYSYKKTDRKYPNATIYDICEAINKDPFDIAARRQDYIDGILKFIHKIAFSEHLTEYKNSNGEPLCDLLGLPQIQSKENLKSFLNGVYLAYCMDNFNPWRTRVFEKYGIGMGGGEIYFGNLDALKNLNLTLENLSTEEHSDEDIYDLFQLGVLKDEGKLDRSHEGVYVRRKKGGGSIDDLAIVIATIMWGEHGGIGVMLNDAVDTLDKFVPYILKNGQDELIGRKIADLQPQLNEALGCYKVPDDDLIVDMMAVIAGHNYTGRSHSSQRYLNQIDIQTGQTALESHLNFALAKPYKQMFLSHPSLKLSNKAMYRQFKEKMKHFFPKMEDVINKLETDLTWDEMEDPFQTD